MKAFEDYEVGSRDEYGAYAVTEDEVIAFAKVYDAQPFHVDREAARQSIYGGLIASGWHTCAMMMRMIVDHRIADRGNAVLASPGFDDLSWLKPVRPGDVLSVRSEILEAVPSKSRPDRGSIRIRNRIVDQHGEVKMELTSIAIVLRRAAAEAMAQRA